MSHISRNKVYIGKTLKALREDRGFTQSELALKVGLHKGSISAYECDSALPSIEILVELADIFGVSTDFLLGRSEDSVRKYYLTEKQKDALDNLMKTLEQENISNYPDTK